MKQTTEAVREQEQVEIKESLCPNRKQSYLIMKRAFDIISSGLGMLILSPVFLITAIAIKIEDPKGRVFYNQPRIGINGTTFSATEAILWIPPRIMTAPIKTSIPPIISPSTEMPPIVPRSVPEKNAD